MRCATFIPSSGQRVTRRTLRRTGTGEPVGAVPLTFDLQQSVISTPDGDGERRASPASTAQQYSVLNARLASSDVVGDRAHRVRRHRQHIGAWIDGVPFSAGFPARAARAQGSHSITQRCWCVLRVALLPGVFGPIRSPYRISHASPS